jgi:flagellum-specific ATP synthase
VSAAAIAEASLAACRPARVAPAIVGRVVSVHGPFLRAKGFACPIGTGALVDGDVRCEVVGFERDEAILISLSGAASILPGAPVVTARSSREVFVGSALLGRVIDAQGLPVDGAGPLFGAATYNVHGTARHPLVLGSVTTRFGTGVRAIDGLLTLGRGQRVILAAGSGVGKTTLIRQIIEGAQADVCIVALVGERNREIADFVSALRISKAKRHTITVAVPGDRSPLLRIRAAQRATTIAEFFRDQGKSVLLVVDSLTRVAHAQRELGLGLGETPTMKGYPPSSLALIPALLERCGVDVVTGGSITALYTVLADGDDIDDPVVDTARAIADGHIILSRGLAEQGIFPAIDIGRSLSRVMADVAAAGHKSAAARVRRLWSIAEENRDLALMGAYRAGADPLIDEALTMRAAILDFIAQPVDHFSTYEDTIGYLIEAFAV